jgi:hypothetical protein
MVLISGILSFYSFMSKIFSNMLLISVKSTSKELFASISFEMIYRFLLSSTISISVSVFTYSRKFLVRGSESSGAFSLNYFPL